MWKDGHLVDELQQYLRVKDPNTDAPHVAIYNSQWAIFGAEEEWNKGSVSLQIICDFYNKQSDCTERLREVAEQSSVIEWVGD